MRAAIFSDRRRIDLAEVEPPLCAADEVIVEVRRAGICGTDLHIFHGQYIAPFPLIGGHEFTGEVAEVGTEVVDVVVGQRVAVDPNLSCGHCTMCRRQRQNHCLAWQGIGITRAGAFAEQVAVPATACYVVPPGLSDAQAAAIEPVSCVVHAMNRLRVEPGDAVLVVGAGPMGLLLIQALRHRGAGTLVAVDQQPDRLALAERCGAGAVVLADEQDRHLPQFAPHGFQVVVDASGHAAAIEQAISWLGPGGRFCQFGVTPTDAVIRVKPFELFRHDLTLLGSFALCYTFAQAIAWIEAGVIEIAPLVSHVVPLADFSTVFKEFARGATLKVQIASS